MTTKTPGSAKLSFFVDAIYNASVRNRGRCFARMASSRGIDGVNVPSSEDPTMFHQVKTQALNSRQVLSQTECAAMRRMRSCTGAHFAIYACRAACA